MTQSVTEGQKLPLTLFNRKFIRRMFILWLILAVVFVVIMSLYKMEILSWFSTLQEGTWRVTGAVLAIIGYSVWFILRKKS